MRFFFPPSSLQILEISAKGRKEPVYRKSWRFWKRNIRKSEATEARTREMGCRPRMESPPQPGGNRKDRCLQGITLLEFGDKRWTEFLPLVSKLWGVGKVVC